MFEECSRLYKLLNLFAGDMCEKGYDPCGGFKCYHGGRCYPTGPNRNFPECRYCDDGWTGKHCDKKIDNCEDNNCAHYAKCVDTGRSYKCVCNDGDEGG